MAIDLGAMTHVSGQKDAFEDLDTRYRGKLGTASKSMSIEGMGTLKLYLRDPHTGRIRVARLGGVKYIPGLRGMLLSTQVLCVNGIFNEHGLNGYSFYHLVKGKKKTMA